MKRLVRLVLLAILLSRPVVADDGLLHVAAHVGSSYTLTMVSYGLLTLVNWPQKIQTDPTDKVPRLMLAGFTALMVGFLYKHLEHNVTPHDFQRAMLLNGVGVSGAIGSVLLFKF